MNNEPPLRLDSDSPKPPAVAGMAGLGFLAYAAAVWLSFGILRGNFVPLVLLFVAAIYLAWQRRWRGFALGVLIGVGLTLLLVGVCFAVIASK